MQRRTAFVVALALVTSAALPAARPATAAVRAGSVTGWVPYWLGGSATSAGTGRQSMLAAADAGLMTEVMPFWFTARGASEIGIVASAAALKPTVDDARSRGLRVIPSVTDGTGRLVMQGILTDPATRAEHVAALVSLAVNGVNGVTFDGIDLDYEGFAFTDGRATWAATQEPWLAFLKELSDALHASGKILSVTVPPVWDDGASGYWLYFPPQTETWARLTSVVDRLRLMVYDYNVGKPGPIAPMSWVDNVLAYVKKMTPPSDLTKVWLGVPQHGRSWARVEGECPDTLPTGVSLSTTSVLARNATQLAATHGATVTETVGSGGRLEGEKTFGWPVGTFSGQKTVSPAPPAFVPPTKVVAEVVVPAEPTLKPALRLKPTSKDVTCTVSRVVHVPDNASVVQRAKAAEAAGLGGIVLWAFGYESLDLWSTLVSA